MTSTPSTGLFRSSQCRVLTSLRNIPTMTTPRRPADHGLDLPDGESRPRHASNCGTADGVRP